MIMMVESIRQIRVKCSKLIGQYDKIQILLAKFCDDYNAEQWYDVFTLKYSTYKKIRT